VAMTSAATSARISMVSSAVARLMGALRRPRGAGQERLCRIAPGRDLASRHLGVDGPPEAKVASHCCAIAIYTSLAGSQARISLSAPQSDAPSPAARTPLRFAVLGRELPYLAMLLLSFAGIAYTTFAQQSSTLYWEILVPIFAAICIVTGWYPAYDQRKHWRLLWTQILHWGAFLAAMHLMFMPGVQRLMNTGANGLSILILLALGTFVAGVHAGTWQISFVGIVLALGVPAIAWVEQSALLVVIAVLALMALAVGFWLVVHHLRAKFISPSVPQRPAASRSDDSMRTRQ
jgi:hypothetical protein